VVRDVADHLGNTPAVARSAYIDPRVVERFEADDTIDDALAEVDLDELGQGIPEELEVAVLDLIDRARRRREKRRRPSRR
jgi:DNA topoisomerase-1